MELATVFCLTATGNSLYAAKRIAESMDARVLPMRESAAPCGDGVIGFVFPVYFWGLPRAVTRFVSELRITDKNAYVFAVASNGGAPGGALGALQKLLKPQGVPLRYGKTLIASTNYIPLHQADGSEALRQRTDEGLAEIIRAVQGREANEIPRQTFVHSVGPLLCPRENSDRFFTVAPACKGCGVCESVCPAGNISLDAGRPVFGHRCEHCLACLHACPVRAIDWKGKTEGKARYRNAHVSVKELIAFQGRERK